MANRKQRKAIADETIKILEEKKYRINGSSVFIGNDLDHCVRHTRHYSPEELTELLEWLAPELEKPVKITVSNRTTFAGAQGLINEGYENPCCLNFASAMSPGGGFLSGSQAQEEALARASGLYASLKTQEIYYTTNRGEKSSLYTDNLIYSPSVPVFRNDSDELLEVPYKVSIITSPAVNARAVQENEPENMGQIEGTMRHRIKTVLAVAMKNGHDALVLGAWGCGVFRNNPHDVATWFKETLTKDELFKNAFARVEFSVLDFAQNTPTFKAFESVFREEIEM